ncbi:hypothetical protein ACFL4N_04100 [Thermodesulfobacteriota bacterium]
MMSKAEIVEQTDLAFDFLQKLYLEVSYLIKEMEGLLGQEEEKFIIGRPGGYSISSRSSMGLEPVHVSLWLMRKLAVFFVPEDQTARQGGTTTTEIDDNLKVLYLRVVLNDGRIKEPEVHFGVFFNVKKQANAKRIEKFEHLMGHFQYNDEKIFSDSQKINYEDARIKLKGSFVKCNLFAIKDSQTIAERIIKPALDLYRKT